MVRLNRRFCRSPEPILAHQPGDAPAADGKPIVGEVRAPCAGCRRSRFGRVKAERTSASSTISSRCRRQAGRSFQAARISLALTSRTLHRRWTGKSFFAASMRRQPHRLPSLAKKVAALFRISRSCRKISFSRRNRFNSARQDLLPLGRRRFQITLPALVDPSPQRRKADLEILGNLALCAPASVHQTHGLRLKFFAKPAMRLAESTSSSSASEESSPALK